MPLDIVLIIYEKFIWCTCLVSFGIVCCETYFGDCSQHWLQCHDCGAQYVLELTKLEYFH